MWGGVLVPVRPLSQVAGHAVFRHGNAALEQRWVMRVCGGPVRCQGKTVVKIHKFPGACLTAKSQSGMPPPRPLLLLLVCSFDPLICIYAIPVVCSYTKR